MPLPAVEPTPTRSIRAARAASTRQQLIDAAVSLFSERSYDDVRVGEIAKRAGVENGMLFDNFGSKRGLYLVTLAHAARRLDEPFVFDQAAPALEQIRAAYRAHLVYLHAHRGFALRLILRGRGADPETWKVYDTTRLHALMSIGELLGLDVKRPAMVMAGRATVGALDEATACWLSDDLPFDLDTMVDYFIRVMRDGLRAATTLDPTVDVTGAVEALS